MFTPPVIASEIARDRHREDIARAERYRLRHSVNHPSTQSRWRHLRASLLRWLLRSGARDSSSPMSDCQEDAIAGDPVSHCSHLRAAAS